jgi:hemerythrin-like domain-containing protein
MTPRLRREVLGLLVTSAGGVTLGCAGGAGAPSSPAGGRTEGQAGAAGCEQENEVLPVEDLMREHGVLRRILLVYGEWIRRVESPAPQDFPADALAKAADIVRRFVEDYHEKLEEDHLFPRFRRAGKLTALVDTLGQQHQAGRRITQQVLASAPAALRDMQARRALVDPLRAFVRMYDAHSAREDTVLFPELHALVSAHEYDALGEEFERKERQLFGGDGFEKIVAEVDDIERSLGIEDLVMVTAR